MRNSTLFACLAPFVLATGLQAQEAKKPKAKKSAGESISERTDEVASDIRSYSSGSYGMAGCGLGSIVITENSFLQVSAATTNGTSGNQTFGITSGTSNCTGRSKGVAAVEQKVFVDTNYAQLVKESSQGDGEHLRAFAALLGCEQADFLNYNKANQAALYQGNDSSALLLKIKKDYAGKCERVESES